MIEAFGENRNKDLSNSLILAGENVSQLPAPLLNSYAEKISATLTEHPDTMIQYSPREIYQAMVEDRAVVAMDIQTNELLGFCQLWKLADGVLEAGTWTSYATGIGKPVLWGASLVGNKLDPKAQVVAIVEESNIPPQVSITKIGGVLIGSKTSEIVFNQDSLQPAQMKIYDISLNRLVVSRPHITQLRESLDESVMKPVQAIKSPVDVSNIWKRLAAPVARILRI